MARCLVILYIASACAASLKIAEGDNHRGHRANLQITRVDGASLVNLSSDSSRQHGFGDLTCMRFTGGSCSLFSCHSERGPTVCEKGLCMCASGTCASAAGKCVARQGKWLGKYSIMFTHPYDRSLSFVGVALEREDVSGTKTRYTREEGRDFGRLDLKGTSDSSPEWRLALSPGGHIYFESLSLPSHVMTLQHKRERGILLQKRVANATGAVDGNSAHQQELQKGEASFPETHTYDDDIWPVVIPFREASPLDVTFQIRPTDKDGGGLEIWHPQTQSVLASGNPGLFYSDHVAEKGIAECNKKAESIFLRGCKGRQLVQFEPEVPSEATPSVIRAQIEQIAVLSWWQKPTFYVLPILLFCCVCCFVAAPHPDRESKEATQLQTGSQTVDPS